MHTYIRMPCTQGGLRSPRDLSALHTCRQQCGGASATRASRLSWYLLLLDLTNPCGRSGGQPALLRLVRRQAGHAG
jgi:hypothetical protein